MHIWVIVKSPKNLLNTTEMCADGPTTGLGLREVSKELGLPLKVYTRTVRSTSGAVWSHIRPSIWNPTMSPALTDMDNGTVAILSSSAVMVAVWYTEYHHSLYFHTQYWSHQIHLDNLQGEVQKCNINHSYELYKTDNMTSLVKSTQCTMYHTLLSLCCHNYIHQSQDKYQFNCCITILSHAHVHESHVTFLIQCMHGPDCLLTIAARDRCSSSICTGTGSSTWFYMKNGNDGRYWA